MIWSGQTWRACQYFTYPLIEALDSLMGCDLGNICAKAERQTSEKFVNENRKRRLHPNLNTYK
jgi:hypothetical protein